MSNTNLIQPNDPRYFTQTSDGDYDRHVYRVVLKDGRSTIIDDYEQMRAFWFQYESKLLSHVEVIDACQYDVDDCQDTKQSVKGFGS